jgi:alpha-galactosidase
MKKGKQISSLWLLMMAVTLTSVGVNSQKKTSKDDSQTTQSSILAPTPTLGWNSFDSYGITIYEELAIKEIDAFIEKFAPFGYEYFVIDNGWFASPQTVIHKGLMMAIADKPNPAECSVDNYGIPIPAQKFFPNALKPMVDKLHAKGLKFGVHLMRGIPRIAVERNLPIKGTNYTAKDIFTTINDCGWCKYMHGVDMSKPGAQEYYNSVFNQFAAWGIDFVKIDDVTHFPAEIEGYVKAIAQCGRPIVLSLSPGGDTNTKYLETYKKTNLLRTTPDIWDEQLAIDRSFDSMRKWQGLEQPGFWPDLDMIPFGELCILRSPEIEQKDPKKTQEEFMGRMHHWCFFSELQKETFITQRAIAASPIIIGGSMISMDAHSVKLLTNAEMLGCVKNGVHGKLIYEKNGIEFWSTPIKNIDRGGFQEYGSKEGWIAIFNRTSAKQTVEMDWRYFKFLPSGNYNFHDVWGNQSVENYKKGDKLNFIIEGNGVVFLKFNAIEDKN